MAIVVGGIAALLNYRTTTSQNHEQLRLQHRGQVAERFAKAIEQLGQVEDDRCDVRIGAAYALEQIALDSPEFHGPVMEVLCAFVRRRAQRMELPKTELWDPPPFEEADYPSNISPPEPDVQAVLTVIGRRNAKNDVGPIRLHNSNLDGADLDAADLRGANLQRTSLRATKLQAAKLCEASLYAADLNGTYMHHADVQAADLRYANMQRIWANGTVFRKARFWGADLRNADLYQADLREADLSHKAVTLVRPPGADRYATHWREPYPVGWTTTERFSYPRVNMDGAVLLGALLGGADLQGAEGLTGEQLAAASDLSNVLLPDYLKQSSSGVASDVSLELLFDGPSEEWFWWREWRF